jgi:hypothetical protein
MSFYRESLTRVGWLPLGDTTKNTTSLDKLRFGYSVSPTLYAAQAADPCAPTPGTGLPDHGVYVTILGAAADGIVVEVEETYIQGY